MIELIISILGIFITIFFVIGTHEYAHFIVARLLNIKVLRFSIGFGKRLLHWYDKKGTEYVVALVPLGGYVKMLDEHEGKVSENELHLAFNRQPFYKKFLVVIAGPTMNILCALLLYWLIFMNGFVTIKPIIGKVSPDSIAYESGLKSQQEILSIDNNVTSSWTNIILRILAHVGNQDTLKMDVKDPTTQKTITHSLDLSNWHMDELSPDPLTSLGIIPYAPEPPLTIGAIAKNSPALNSGLQLNDKLIAVDKKPIKDWQTLITLVHENPDKDVLFTVERKGKNVDIMVRIGYQHASFFKKSGYLGISPYAQMPKELLQKIQYKPLAALHRAWQEIVNFTYLNFLLIGKMILGKLSLRSLGGPITIFQTAGSTLNYSFLAFAGFLAFLSLSIGIINLLPIPGLDGGHLLFQTIELILGRPVPERVMLLFYRLGFILIIFILIQALINDLLRLY